MRKGCIAVFGPGYTATRIMARLETVGWTAIGLGREASEADVAGALHKATHILSSVPPESEADPVLERWGAAIAAAPAIWIGYLSSTGVYGDTRGAWVDESAAIGSGRRSARAKADLDWQALGPRVRVFRLPGIYGPGRSPIDRVKRGSAHRIDQKGQVFSRIHVDDIVSGVMAALNGPDGVYNLADDEPCPQNRVIEHAAALLGMAPPPMLSVEEARLSPQARSFYSETRRVANGKAKRLLGWQPTYPTYREGLGALVQADRLPSP